jgi:hypothetical protein
LISGEVVGKYSSESKFIGEYLDVPFGEKYSVYYTRLTALDLAPIVEAKVIIDANGRIY